MAWQAHIAYQYHNIPPGIYMGFRTANDLIPEGERVFMAASDLLALEQGDTRLSVKHFNSNGKESK